MRDQPKISIVTPSFNQGKYLERTILSVLQQNYPNLEYIIIDGGSTDNSVDIIKKYASKITYWISQKDSGQSNALNKGLGKVTGDIVAWINSDDWYDEGVLLQVVQHFNENPGRILLGHCTRHYEESGKSMIIPAATPTFQSMLRYWKPFFCPAQPSIFFPSACIKQVGLLDESLHYAMDLDLWLRMARQFQFYSVDKNFSHYLIHDDSKSGSGIGFRKFRKEWRMVCFKHLKHSSFWERTDFYIDYYYHRLFKPSRIRES